MNLDIIYNEVEYTVEGIEYDEYDPGDRWTPPCPGGVIGWDKIIWNKTDITEVFDSLVDTDDFIEQLDMMVAEEIEDRKTDYLIDKYELD